MWRNKFKILYLAFVGIIDELNLTAHLTTSSSANPLPPYPLVDLDAYDIEDRLPRIPRPLRTETVRVDLTRLVTKMNA
jgi:hypothetical protein